MQDDERGFMGSLFDLSFSHFISTRVVRFLFAVGILGCGIETIYVIVQIFRGGFWRGFFFLLISPLWFLLSVAVLRLWCEFVIVVFRIAEHTGKLAGVKDEASTE